MKTRYIIIFLTSLVTLALEITLTRIFSVTMWYHYAFMAISLAMLGMSTGAVTVFVKQYATQSHKKIRSLIARHALLLSASILLSLLIQLAIPFVPRLTAVGIFTTAFLFSVTAVPFYASGVIVALLLTTKYMKDLDRLYAADLAGAALGTLLFFFFMSITDAPSFVIALSAVAAGIAWIAEKRKKNATLVIVLTALFLVNHLFTPIKIEWEKVANGSNKAILEQNIEWERWTPFSRITVSPYHDDVFGWGVSPVLKEQYPDDKIPQKLLTIDSAAGTVITGNKEPFSELHYLRFDVTNLAHYFVNNGRVAVIGVGGGRDILSALYFRQKEVWGIEINNRILQAITSRYRHFTYPFSEMPRVHLVNDEARNFIERSSKKFDIIQASLIDSWAATASGAFVLTENSLYTVEAWKIFLNHLTDKGILTMSRWYFPKRPGEMLRLANLAWKALKENGVKDPKRHIMMAGVLFHGKDAPTDRQFGTGTILVSKQPFSKKDISAFFVIAKQLKFDVILAAGKEKSSEFSAMMDPKKRERLLRDNPLNLYAPTDDSPFFFNTLRPSALLFHHNIDKEGPLSTNLKAVSNLLILLLIVIILVSFFIVVPLLSTLQKPKSAIISSPTFYFAAIGMGFMLIEVSLIQKFTVFLGHPTWSIVVVLFTILLFTGFGSSLSSKAHRHIGLVGVFGILFAVLLSAGLINILFISHFTAFSLPMRLVYAFVVMILIGTVLGMPFPIGMNRLRNTHSETIAPWLWGINGAFSVVSSVLATVISLFFGISVTFISGVAFYLIAATVMLLWSRETASQ